MNQNLEEACRQLREVKNEKEQLTARKKELDSKEEYLEGLILAGLRAEGLTSAKTSHGTATIKEEEVPIIEDWNETLTYIFEAQAHPLLKKSVSSAVWRELREMGIEVPGLGVFKKESIQFRRK